MKRIFTVLASLLIVVSFAGIASAEMATIDLVGINPSDYKDVQGLVSGAKTVTPAATAAQPAPSKVGLVGMDASELTAVQDYVDGRKVVKADSKPASRDNTVNTGFVEMNPGDYQDLKKKTSWMKDDNQGQMIEKLHVWSK